MTSEQLDQLSINTIRTLSMDAVQQAKSGHPGTPMALAPLVYTIWNRVMQFNPQDPIWPNRDRFVLSNGHASMLLHRSIAYTRTWRPVSGCTVSRSSDIPSLTITRADASLPTMWMLTSRRSPSSARVWATTAWAASVARPRPSRRGRAANRSPRPA